MFKLNQKPHIKFFHNTGNIISESNTVFNHVFKKDNYFIDKSIKTGVNNINIWHQLEILISSFILNKSPKYFLNINN